MKRYTVHKKGYEGSWYYHDTYLEKKGYEVFFNHGILVIRKDGHTILQGGADNFYFEIDNEDS